MLRYAFVAVTLGLAGPVYGQQALTAMVYGDPVEYTNDTPLPKERIATRLLHCGNAEGQYLFNATVPEGGRLTKQQLLDTVVVKLDRTYFCAATAITVDAKESWFSEEVRFFCARIGKGPAHQRRIECFIGDRVPPGQIGRDEVGEASKLPPGQTDRQ